MLCASLKVVFVINDGGTARGLRPYGADYGRQPSGSASGTSLFASRCHHKTCLTMACGGKVSSALV